MGFPEGSDMNAPRDMEFSFGGFVPERVFMGLSVYSSLR